MSIETLMGKTILSITGAEDGSDMVVFVCTDRTRVTLSHYQACCESVTVADVTGDVNDLIGQTILMAEEVSEDDTSRLSGTWTFYKLRSHGGDVTIRWLGVSNGYYSERVSVDVDEADIFNLSEADQVLADKLLENGK